MQPANTPPTDWKQARGLWMLDYNCYNCLVRATVEEVARAIADDVEVWEQDVLGRPVVVRPDSLFVFRLPGHLWSVLAARAFARTPYGFKNYEWERSLSRRLGQPIILYGRSDTCGLIGYTMIEAGEMIEDFSADGGADDDPEDDENNRPNTKRSYFNSTRRKMSLDQIADMYEFVNDFLVEQDAFVPGIEFEYFFDHEEPPIGEAGLVQNSGFVFLTSPGWEKFRITPEIERVDYLVLRTQYGVRG
jgi:hypothetical protein